MEKMELGAKLRKFRAKSKPRLTYSINLRAILPTYSINLKAILPTYSIFMPKFGKSIIK